MSNEHENSSFDVGNLLEEILKTGKEYVEKGQILAEEKLKIPVESKEREIMLDGLKKGALASALLVGLLGTSGGRKLTRTAIKVGGLAALGTVAYKGYQNWQSTGDVMSSAGQAVHELTANESEPRGLLIIDAMVAAANADGNVDDQELQEIKREALEMHLPGEMAMILENVIASPLSAGELAQKVNNRVEASEVYIATRLLIDGNSSLAETLYKDSLVTALNLSDELVASLEAQIL
jgi:uncharacterized membrane protein YebE (DUF533 family)